MPAGRPSEFTTITAAVILERITDGRSLRDVCTDEDMPARSTVFKWLMQNKEFADQYARACDDRAEHIFEETIEIADDRQGDYTTDKDGKEVVNQENIQRARLRVDTRKWFVSKLAPKKYGEKQQIEHSGSINVSLADRIENARKRG